LFGTAANNGQMIAEFSSSHRTADAFRGMAHLLTGRSDDKKSPNGLLLPLIHKLLKRSRAPQKRKQAA
jgi:pilus assembly protein CpaE